MEYPTDRWSKVNVFALPNQTTILFGLIVVVLFGSVILGSVGSSPVPVWAIAGALLLLTFHAFLSYPERHIKHSGLQEVDSSLTALQTVIDTLAKKIQLKRVPKLLVTSEAIGVHTFGTWRHRFIAINEKEAMTMKACLDNPELAEAAEAKLIHELYHFKTGDYWQMSFTQELLRRTFTLMGWAILFFMGFGFLMIVAGQAVLAMDVNEIAAQIEPIFPIGSDIILYYLPSPEELAEVRKNSANVNLGLAVNFVVTSFFPFVLICGVLNFFYWPKLWRMRELYADAGVVYEQKKILPLISNIVPIPLKHLQKHPDTTQKLAQTIKKQNAFQKWKERLRHPRKLHYSDDVRLWCVLEPKQIYGSWKDTAVLLGSLTLLLDVLLVSPLTLLSVGQWPMHFTTMVVFAIVSLNLIPVLVQGHASKAYVLKVVSTVIGIRFVWLLITLGALIVLFFLVPDYLENLLLLASSSVGRYAGSLDNIAFDDVGAFILEASVLNLAQIVIVFLVLIFSLLIFWLMLRRIFTWYRFPNAENRLMKIAYWAIGIGTIALGTIILPLVTSILLNPAFLRNPIFIIVFVFGLLITAVSLGWFLRKNRQYGGLCPKCNTRIMTPYRLGNRCSGESCDELLHPWLRTEYKV